MNGGIVIMNFNHCIPFFRLEDSEKELPRLMQRGVLTIGNGKKTQIMLTLNIGIFQEWGPTTSLQRHTLKMWSYDTFLILTNNRFTEDDIELARKITSDGKKYFFVNDIWNKSYVNCGNEMKRRNDRRSERNLCNCVKKPEKKIQDSWPRDYRCDALPTELWSHWRWEQVNCGFICSRERNEC